MKLIISERLYDFVDISRAFDCLPEEVVRQQREHRYAVGRIRRRVQMLAGSTAWCANPDIFCARLRDYHDARAVGRDEVSIKDYLCDLITPPDCPAAVTRAPEIECSDGARRLLSTPIWQLSKANREMLNLSRGLIEARLGL